MTGPAWYLIGGTSEATPLMAGIVALADQVAHHPPGDLNQALYEMGDGPFSGLTDITHGNNTVTFTNSNNATYTVPGWNAVPGYDLSSGLRYAQCTEVRLRAGRVGSLIDQGAPLSRRAPHPPSQRDWAHECRRLPEGALGI